MLIAETHFTKKTYFKAPNYKVYHTDHPDGTAHGGTAIIIRNGIKHYPLDGYKTEHIQATNIVLYEHLGPICISATYCPPKHNIKKHQYEHFFKTLGNKFIVGGNWNAKNTQWGSRHDAQRQRTIRSYPYK